MGPSWEIDANTGGELSVRWWKWALSAPDDHSPVTDTTGEHAAWNQPDDVWFLAGTYGGRTTRTCPLPAGRPVFFPVLNIEHSRSYSKRPVSLPVAEALARLNGMPLQVSEFTGQFRTGFTRRYAWGLWGALAPLLPGQYVLEIKADTGDGFWVDTTYHLTATDA